MTSEAGKNRIWPKLPYPGLNYFRPADRPLLTGRQNDILECTTLLAHPATRVLLLHGATGCGKSSFLRAGLIPEMEEQGAGHLFLKTTGEADEALFIRCTESPVGQIARQVFLFASRSFVLHTPKGPRTLDVSPALLEKPTWEDYLATATDPDFLLESLRKIAQIIPQTLVLILDQAEEVLTLNLDTENYVNRLRFFAFLRKFQELEFDSRIIVALRTEYFGRFIDATQINFQITAEFRQFLLGELSRDMLIEAIYRPTLKSEICPFGIPHNVYGFTFEPQLAEMIVDDILGARFSGPALPVLQLVCRSLYENMKAHRASVIASTAYTSRGRVEGLLMEHIRSAIQAGYDDEAHFQQDSEKIRHFLESFYILQDDNTVVARSRTTEWAKEQLSLHNLHIASDALLESLTSPGMLILRTIRSVSPNGSIIDELTLGHDFVALALERWKAKEAELRAIRIQEEMEKFEIETNIKIKNIVSEHEKARSRYTEAIYKLMSATAVPLITAILTVVFSIVSSIFFPLRDSGFLSIIQWALPLVGLFFLISILFYSIYISWKTKRILEIEFGEIRKDAKHTGRRS